MQTKDAAFGSLACFLVAYMAVVARHCEWYTRRSWGIGGENSFGCNEIAAIILWIPFSSRENQSPRIGGKTDLDNSKQEA